LLTYLLTYHQNWTSVRFRPPAKRRYYNFGRVCESACLSVCLSDDNFRKPWHRKFIFAHPVYLRRIRVTFLYECHRVKVKVTGTKKGRKSLFSQCKTKLRSAITPVLSNIEPRSCVQQWGFWLWRIESLRAQRCTSGYCWWKTNWPWAA